MDIYDFIRQKRKELHWTQEDLAEKTGLSHYRIFAIESGKGNLNFTEAIRILDALGYTLRVDGVVADINTREQIRDARIQQDKTQYEVAEKAGLYKSSIKKAEHGEPLQYANMEAIINALGMEITIEPRPDAGAMDASLRKACKAIRQENGLTQRQLAEKAGVAMQTISNFEQGSGGTIETAEKIFSSVGYKITVVKA